MSTLATDLDLVSEQDYADLRGVELSTLRNERAKRVGPPFVVLGRVVWYPKDAILELVRKSTVLPEKPATLTESAPRRGKPQNKRKREAA